MIKLKINGQEVEAEKGTTVLEAAALIGIEIPHFCYHPALEKVGSCRMCQVEFLAPGRPHLGISCRTDVAEGMEVETHSEAAVKARAAVLEFLLANHPLDCPICDKAGECPLQDYTYVHGNPTSRFEEEKRTSVKREHLGSHIIFDSERCILCTRCVRFMADTAKAPQLMVSGRGDHTQIGIFPGRPLDSAYSGNLADICPVGALTLEEFRFKVRAWYLDAVPSICPYCSRGCNIYLDVRKEKNRLFRVRPRVNHDVNGYFICNEGRFRPLEAFASKNRLLACRAGGAESAYEEAIARCAQSLKAEGAKTLVVASARRTLEELYAITRVFRPLEGTEFLAAAPDREEPDGILRTGENAPNLKALEALRYEVLPLESLAARLSAGENCNLVMLDAAINLNPQMRDAFRFVFYMDYVASEVAEWADAVIPGRAWFEKDGTYINADGRVQRIRAALHPPTPAIRDDTATLSALGRQLWGQEIPDGSEDLIRDLAGENEAFKGLSTGGVSEAGVLLDGKGGE